MYPVLHNINLVEWVGATKETHSINYNFNLSGLKSSSKTKSTKQVYVEAHRLVNFDKEKYQEFTSLAKSLLGVVPFRPTIPFFKQCLSTIICYVNN